MNETRVLSISMPDRYTIDINQIRFTDFFDLNRYRFLSIDYSGFNSIRCIRRRSQGPFSRGERERILGTRLVCIIITCANNATKTFQFHVSNNAESL